MFYVTHTLRSTGQEFLKKFTDEKLAVDYYNKLNHEACSNNKQSIYGSVGIEADEKTPFTLI